jgi:hypothetical protein
MADTYGVVPRDIANELPGVFPSGFSSTSIPTEGQVASMITTADTMVGLRVLDVTGDDPDPDDATAAIAVRYIVEWVKALVVRIAYSGRGPDIANAAAAAYADLATSLLATFVAEVEEESDIGVWGTGTAIRSS